MAPCLETLEEIQASSTQIGKSIFMTKFTVYFQNKYLAWKGTE